MAGKTIDATLRLAADFADALRRLRELRKEALDTRRAVSGADGTTAAGAQQQPGATAARAAQEESQAAEASAAARIAADKAAADAHAATLRERLAAERRAAAEAAALARQEQRERNATERKAARERAQAEDGERKSRRSAERKAQAEAANEERATAKARKEEQRKLTQLGPQVSDVVTGLASGQAPGLVLLQQGLQVRDIFGGMANAGRALMQVLTPVRLAIGGIVGVVVALGAAAISGARDSDRLNKTLALTGNIAGTSLGHIKALGSEVAQSTGATVGFARDVVEQLLAVEGQTANTLGATGRAAAALAKLTGESAEEAVRGFANQSAGITDWAVKANKAYNFLTAAQVAHIRRLEAQGRSEEAVRFTNEELARTLQQRSVPAIGAVEKAWNLAGRAVSFFVDQIKDLGRDTTVEDRLKKLQERLDAIRARQAQPLFAGRRKATDRAEVEDIQQEQNTLRRDQVRASERAAAAKAEQTEIKRDSKEFQESLTQIAAAGAQKRLQDALAALDRQQSAVELADAQGVVSARDKAVELNRIEQQRLRAQLTFQRDQLRLAKDAVGRQSNEQDVNAANARVSEIEAQLVATQSRIGQAVADGRRIVEGEALNKARERAQQWADVWLRASQRVRELARDNAVTAAQGVADPGERARLEAEAQVQELRRGLAEQKTELEVQIAVSIDPNQRQTLEQQLQALQREGDAAVAEATRKATQQSLFQQAAEQLDQLRTAEAALALAVEQGALTSEAAERKSFAAREEALPQLREMLRLLREIAKAPAEKVAVEQLGVDIGERTQQITEEMRTLRTSLGSGLGTLFEDVATGAERADRAVGKFVANVARSMLDLIAKQLGQQLIQSLFKSFGNNDGSLYNVIGNLLVSSFHAGGVVGGATQSVARRVSPYVFAGAQVLHGGGIAGELSGLMPDEQPAILRKGEEVLTRDDPRHRANFAGSAPLIGALNVQVTTESTGSAGGDAALGRDLARAIDGKVREVLVEEMRPGGIIDRARGRG